MTDQLDLLPAPPPPEWARSLTGVKAIRVAQGVHPLGGARIKGGPETCGECAHRRRRTGGGIVWHRCGMVRATPGPDGDVRDHWAACEMFEGVAP